jgi:hypothetical protein
MSPTLSEYQRARRVEESVYMARVDGLHFRTYPSPRIVRRRLV